MKILLAFLCGLLISEGYAAMTKEERKAERRAREVAYQSCLTPCFEKCKR